MLYGISAVLCCRFCKRLSSGTKRLSEFAELLQSKVPREEIFARCPPEGSVKDEIAALLSEFAAVAQCNPVISPRKGARRGTIADFRQPEYPLNLCHDPRLDFFAAGTSKEAEANKSISNNNGNVSVDATTSQVNITESPLRENTLVSHGEVHIEGMSQPPLRSIEETKCSMYATKCNIFAKECRAGQRRGAEEDPVRLRPDSGRLGVGCRKH